MPRCYRLYALGMYELPPDFDLGTFVGTEVNRITIGLFQLDIDFVPEDPLQAYGLLSLAGAWELRRDGELVDASEERTREGNERRSSYRVHRLLGRKVTGWTPDPPSAFQLNFEGGYLLRVVDDAVGHFEYLHVSLPGDEMPRWHL